MIGLIKEINFLCNHKVGGLSLIELLDYWRCSQSGAWLMLLRRFVVSSCHGMVLLIKSSRYSKSKVWALLFSG